MTTGRRTGRLRVGGLVAGTLAGVAMIGVGCSSVVHGTATGAKLDAPAYRTSVSQSAAASASKRQVALAKAAVHASCDAFGSSSSDSVTAVNAYVQAFNVNAADAPGKSGPAVDALNHTADVVAASLSGTLPADLLKALNGWVDGSRQLAGVLGGNPGADEFNAAIGQLNDFRTAAGSACSAAY